MTTEFLAIATATETESETERGADEPSAASTSSARRTRPLPSPAALQRQLPLTPRTHASVAAARRAVCEILTGRDRNRILVVVGPCSIHDPESALEYARRLRNLAREHRDELVVVMRTYFEKPRTAVGWKGFINDPALDGSCDLPTGLAAARRLLVEIGELGLACGTELLDLHIAPYLEDLLTWGAIGARTCESQPHRELASGLPMPVGIKNAMNGDVAAAANGVRAARAPHTFAGLCADGRPAAVSTRGNPYAHIILRGGSAGTNFDAASVSAAAALVADAELARRAVLQPVPRLRQHLQQHLHLQQKPIVVDCSHGNSGKDHRLEARACRAVTAQLRAGAAGLAGLMLESHLEAGAQTWSPAQRPAPGQSITDACIGWQETETLLHEIAAAAAARRTERRAAAAPLATV